jgi:cellulose biosynthesis protein BcsQ
LAVCFARAGYRTLAVDLDQQGNLSAALGANLNELSSRFGFPESVTSHLVNCGLIRSKRIRSIFEYRLGWTRGAYPKEITAYLAARGITFDLRKYPLVSEREMYGYRHEPHTREPLA